MGKQFIAAFTIAVLLASCGGDRPTTPAIIHAEQNTIMPGIGQLDGIAPATIPPRNLSYNPIETVYGDETYANSPNIEKYGHWIDLNADPGESAWAVYKLEGLGENYFPIEVEVFFSEDSAPYWLGFANYDTGRWEFLDSPVTETQIIEFSEDVEKHYSQSGNLYFAIVAWGETVKHSRLEFKMVQIIAPRSPRLSYFDLLGDRKASIRLAPYTDPRGTSIRLYMSPYNYFGNRRLVGEYSTDDMFMYFGDLTPNVPYYFAATAYDSYLDIESELSNVSQITWFGTPDGFRLADGLWPRLGGGQDGGGYTSNLGPQNLDSIESVQLSSTEFARPPVIGPSGNVLTVTPEGILYSYDSTLENLNFSVSVSELVPLEIENRDWISGSRSPCIDAYGNAYWYGIEDTDDLLAEGLGYLFCVNSWGGLNWRYNLGLNAMPEMRSAPNFNNAGNLVASLGMYVIAVDPAGNLAWTSPFLNGLPSENLGISSNGRIEFTTDSWWFGRIPPYSHWASIDAETGQSRISFNQEAYNFGNNDGLSLPNNLYYFLASMSPGLDNEMILLDSSTGQWLNELDPLELPGANGSKYARDATGENIIQLTSVDTQPDESRLVWIKVNSGDPPTLELVATVDPGYDLANPPSFTKPSLDGAGRIYFADDQGYLYLAEFDPLAPPNPENLQIIQRVLLDPDNPSGLSDIAIGDGAIYAQSDLGILYRVSSGL